MRPLVNRRRHHARPFIVSCKRARKHALCPPESNDAFFRFSRPCFVSVSRCYFSGASECSDGVNCATHKHLASARVRACEPKNAGHSGLVRPRYFPKISALCSRIQPGFLVWGMGVLLPHRRGLYKREEGCSCSSNTLRVHLNDLSGEMTLAANAPFRTAKCSSSNSLAISTRWLWTTVELVQD